MKKLFAALCMSLLLAPLSAMAWGPSGDVNVIVAYKAGSGTDTGARVLASEAEKTLAKHWSLTIFRVLTEKLAGPS